MRVESFVTGVVAVLLVVHGARAQSATENEGPVLGRHALRPTASVKAWNPRGSIRFVGWDKDSIVMRGRVAKSQRRLFIGDDSSFKLGADGGWADDGSGRSDLVVYLPRRTTVSVKTVSADINAKDVSGWFYTVSGNIRLAGSATSVQVESMSGNLDLDVATPWIKAQTGSGHLLLRGAAQDADLSTVGGTLSIANASVLRGQFSSVTGDIHYAAAPAAGAIFEFSNHSGVVDLLMPQSASATLALFSIVGPIENGFTRVSPAVSTSHAMRLSLGSGDAQITVRTFKGAIRLRPH